MVSIFGLLCLREAVLFALRVQTQAHRVGGGQIIQAGVLRFDQGGAGARLTNLLRSEVLLGRGIAVGVIDVGSNRALLFRALRTDSTQVLFKLGASLLSGVSRRLRILGRFVLGFFGGFALFITQEGGGFRRGQRILGKFRFFALTASFGHRNILNVLVRVGAQRL